MGNAEAPRIVAEETSEVTFHKGDYEIRYRFVPPYGGM